jgi:hypothetical protein
MGRVARAASGASLGLALSACATTARMHSQVELAEVARGCAVPVGEIAQFEEEPRLLFLFPVERARQFVCVSRWARPRGLRVVYLEDVTRVEENAAPN